MNKEQQGIAIAEACGWTAEQDSNGYWRAVDKKNSNAVELWLSEQSVWSVGIPDYLNDLNAMHEAEKVLTEEQRIAYTNHTYDVACKVQRETEKWRWISLTAKQRAEAFLKTIGLWEDGE